MKRNLFLVCGLIALLAVVAVFVPSAQAGTGPHCVSDPSAGAVGTVFNVECTGFTPDTHVWMYMVQPDGATESCAFINIGAEGRQNLCQYKTDETGSIAFWFDSSWDNHTKPAYGTWTVVVQQLGPGFTIVGQAQAGFNISGNSEGVSGAHLWMGADQYGKYEKFEINGHGFAPYEIVSLWLEFPNGDCSTFTQHMPPYFNEPTIAGSSVWRMWDVKADANGEFSTGDYFDSWFCEGKYHFVGRGNTSGNGGEAWATFVGNAVETNAKVWSDKDTYVAMGDSLTISGAGFGADEPVTCWLTNPQNSALEIYHIPEIKTNGSGQFSFSTWTGSFWPHPGYMFFSEGPIGEYAMTCRGNVSGATGIARFGVTGGNILDP